MAKNGNSVKTRKLPANSAFPNQTSAVHAASHSRFESNKIPVVHSQTPTQRGDDIKLCSQQDRLHAIPSSCSAPVLAGVAAKALGVAIPRAAKAHQLHCPQGSQRRFPISSAT
ncbi:hypothetical protein VTN77DRAFT_3973 [Rasamsonia byssochlamydoides]|uniref:uncharacterized protein n=1 Tax=Rasamsonia byssochlamydoides TaxID=89139 RepID=UPI003743B0EB